MADKANGVSDDTVKLALSDCPRYVREYVAALEAKLEAAERDAARWRFVRGNLSHLCLSSGEEYCGPDEERLDAAIDAQRQEGM